MSDLQPTVQDSQERLFMALYLDEDVDVRLAALLRLRGFSVQTTLEAGRTGRSDVEQLAYASQQERALLTHNRVDFEELAVRYSDAGERHWGIVIAPHRPLPELGRRVLELLNQESADQMVDQMRYI